MAEAGIARETLARLSTIAGILGKQSAQVAIKPYSGSPKGFKEWIRAVEKYQYVIGGDGNSCKVFALQSAEGPVSDFLMRYSQTHGDATWAQMKNELRVRFAEISDPQHALNILRHTKQRKEETVQIFAERLLGVAAEAWEAENLASPLVETQLVEIFIDGLFDNAIARKVIREGPRTMQDAVKIAVAEQVLNKKYVLRNRAFQSQNRQHQYERKEEPMEVDSFKGTCYRCGMQGHRAINCKTKKVSEIRNEEGSNILAGIECWKCGQRGHALWACKSPGNPKTGRCWRCGSKEHKRFQCSANLKEVNENALDLVKP